MCLLSARSCVRERLSCVRGTYTYDAVDRPHVGGVVVQLGVGCSPGNLVVRWDLGGTVMCLGSVAAG